MNEEIKTYEDYNLYIKNKIEDVMRQLYKFNRKESGSGSFECGLIANLIMDLGAVSEKIRPYIENDIPIQHKLIDEWIEIIDVEKLDSLFLVAFLRYTFITRNGLNNWIDLRDKTAIKLNSIGKESKQVLRGLYK